MRKLTFSIFNCSALENESLESDCDEKIRNSYSASLNEFVVAYSEINFEQEWTLVRNKKGPNPKFNVVPWISYFSKNRFEYYFHS